MDDASSVEPTAEASTSQHSCDNSPVNKGWLVTDFSRLFFYSSTLDLANCCRYLYKHMPAYYDRQWLSDSAPARNQRGTGRDRQPALSAGADALATTANYWLFSSPLAAIYALFVLMLTSAVIGALFARRYQRDKYEPLLQAMRKLLRHQVDHVCGSCFALIINHCSPNRYHLLLARQSKSALFQTRKRAQRRRCQPPIAKRIRHGA